MKKTLVILFTTLLLTALASAAPPHQETGILGDWHFNHTSATTLKDFSGLGNDGAEQGSGVTLGFNGVDNTTGDWDDPARGVNFSGGRYEVSGFSVGGGGSTEITISLWFNTSSDTQSRGLRFTNSVNSGFFQIFVPAGASGEVGTRLDSNGGACTPASSVKDYADGKVHNAVFTYNGSHCALYLDKTRVELEALTGAIAHKTGTLGIAANPGGSSEYQGVLMNAKIYNTSINTSQLDNLFDFNQLTQPSTLQFPTVSFNSPANASISNDSPVLNATIDDADSPWVTSTAFLDGSVLVNDFNGTVPYFLVNTTSGLAEGQHNYTVTATDPDSQSTTESRFFTVDTVAPVINITAPIGDVVLGNTNTPVFNFTANDATSQIDTCIFNANNGTGNITQGTCGSTTLTYSTVGNHTVDLWVTDTAGNTAFDSQTFTTDLTNNVTATDSETSLAINSFTASFTNGTTSFDFSDSTTDGTLEVVTSDLPTGASVTVTVESTGYVDGSTTANINESSAFSASVQLDPVSVSYEIFDESTNDYIINPGFVTANNGTHIETYGVLNRLNTDDTSGIGSAGAAFDRNLNTATTSGLGSGGDLLVGYVAFEQVADNNLSVRGTQASGASGDLQVFNDDTQTWDTISSAPFAIGAGTTTKSFTVNNTDGQYDSGQVRITNGNTQATVNEIWAGSLSVIEVPTDEVLLGNVTLQVNDVDSTDLDDYRSRRFFVEITDTDRNIHTYLLKRTDGIQANIQTVDELDQDISDALITLTREFGFTTVTVAQRKTASGGTATFFVDPDEVYGLNASKAGFESFSGTFNGQPYQFSPLVITLDSLDVVDVAISRFEVLSLYTFSCSQSVTSFNCTFDHSSNEIFSTNLTVKQDLPIGTSTVCDVGDTTSSGTLVCTGLNITANTYNFVLFSVTNAGDSVTLDTGTLSTPSNDYDGFGLFAFLFIVVTLAMIGLWQPEAVILLSAFAVPLGFFTGILAIDQTSVVSIIAVAAILLWRLRR